MHGIDCGVAFDRIDDPDPAAPHYPAVTAAHLSEDTTFAEYLTMLDGSTVLTPEVAGIGGQIGGRCAGQAGRPGLCWLNWHQGNLVVGLVIAGGTGDITRENSEAMLTAMVPDVIANLKQAATIDDLPPETTAPPATASTTVPEPPPTTSGPTTTALPQVSLPPPTTAPDTGPDTKP